jgi:hypothetical protein
VTEGANLWPGYTGGLSRPQKGPTVAQRTPDPWLAALERASYLLGALLFLAALGAMTFGSREPVPPHYGAPFVGSTAIDARGTFAAERPARGAAQGGDPSKGSSASLESSSAGSSVASSASSQLQSRAPQALAPLPRGLGGVSR